MRDYNHDGKVDKQDYYDDLGGAYHFRPPGLDDNGVEPGHKILELICNVILIAVLLAILILMGCE